MELKNKVVLNAIAEINDIATREELKEVFDGGAQGAVIFFGSADQGKGIGTTYGIVAGGKTQVVETIARCFVQHPELIAIFETAIKVAPMVALKDTLGTDYEEIVKDKDEPCECPKCRERRNKFLNDPNIN